MATFQTIPWGTTQIRFFASRLAKKDVEQAASLVAPSFENLPKDSFVGSGKSGMQIISTVSTKPKAKIFPVSIDKISIQEAIRQALEQAAIFLQGQA
jgi:hypothetical protein